MALNCKRSWLHKIQAPSTEKVVEKHKEGPFLTFADTNSRAWTMRSNSTLIAAKEMKGKCTMGPSGSVEVIPSKGLWSPPWVG